MTWEIAFLTLMVVVASLGFFGFLMAPLLDPPSSPNSSSVFFSRSFTFNILTFSFHQMACSTANLQKPFAWRPAANARRACHVITRPIQTFLD